MGPQRIVCLTAETTEIVFALGLGQRVVGVSGYAVRPPEARKKPKVAAFRTAHVERILALDPDLVIGFSDLQAEIAAELIRRGANVLITNQRTLAETYTAICLIAGAVGEHRGGEQIVAAMRAELERIAASVASRGTVRVFFEEWDEPLIRGIAWVSELIALCGGVDVFANRGGSTAAERIVDPRDVIERDPEVILASWCGKRVKLERIAGRHGWDQIAAVRNGRIHEIKAPDILQPGPSLVHGARLMAELIHRPADPGARRHALGPGSTAK